VKTFLNQNQSKPKKQIIIRFEIGRNTEKSFTNYSKVDVKSSWKRKITIQRLQWKIIKG
jgi:hypothetical protein